MDEFLSEFQTMLGVFLSWVLALARAGLALAAELFAHLREELTGALTVEAPAPADGSAQTAVLLLLRVLIAVLAVWLLSRCTRSLLRGQPEQEQWGSLVLENGTSLPLNHWENLIGRAKHCDVELPFAAVSRDHAALIRDDRGGWMLHALPSKNGVTLNSVPVLRTAEVHAGDVLGFGPVFARFVPLTEEGERAQMAHRTRPGRELSPSASLVALTALQLLLLASLMTALETGQEQTLLSFGILITLEWVLYAVYRAAHRTGYELETLAFFLCSLSLTVTASSAPDSLLKQTAAIGIGVVLFLLLSLALRDLTLAKRLQFPLAVAAAALLAFNLLFGTLLFGARNWIVLGPISFQPSELVKLVFILVGAATLDRLFDKKNLIGSLVFSVFYVGCLGLMSDFGTALIFFVAFLAIAFLRSGDLPSILFMVAAAGVGCVLILHYKSYIAERFAVYRHVWEDTSNYGYQQTRTMSAIASGGLFGRGAGEGWLKNLGAANTDLVFGVVSEELGLLVALSAVLAIVVMTLFAVRQASAARSSFYVICSCTAAMLLVVQTMLNVFGSVDLLPLTGVTLPFVSVGGTSMLSCWGLLAFLKTADTRQNASLSVRLPKREHENAAQEKTPPSGHTRRTARHAAEEPTRVVPPTGDTGRTRRFTGKNPNAARQASGTDTGAWGTNSNGAPLHTDADDWQDYFEWEEDDQ